MNSEKPKTNHYPNLTKWIENGCPVFEIDSKKLYQKAKSIISEAHVAKNDSIEGLDYSSLSQLEVEAEYAGRRHWTFKWVIIAGAILSVILMNWWAGSKDEDVADHNKLVESIKAWPDTPLASAPSPESFKEQNHTQIYSNRFASPEAYRDYMLDELAMDYYGAQKYIESEKQRYERITDAKQKKYCMDGIKKLEKEWPGKEKKLKSKINKISKADFKEIQSLALKEANKKLESKQNDASWVKFWFWFLIICIPLYIFACRPHGYNLLRDEEDSIKLGSIHRFFLWISGGLAGAAAALQFREVIVKTTWSNGTTTTSREDDGSGPVILALKIGLIAAAVLVFCLASCAIMGLATAIGLYRNYDWKEILSKSAKK